MAFTVSEAATHAGICRNTLIKLTDDGEIRCFIFRGRRMYRREELDRWLNAQSDWQPQKKREKGVSVIEKKNRQA
jgi:excisionase family DNA binding protein